MSCRGRRYALVLKPQRLPGLLLLIAALGIPATAQTLAEHHEDFQAYASQSTPQGFVESGSGGSFAIWPDPLDARNVVYGRRDRGAAADPKTPPAGRFATLAGKEFAATGRLDFRGRFLVADANASIGFTFLSSLPEGSAYYLVGLGRDAAGEPATMRLFTATGSGRRRAVRSAVCATASGGTADSCFTPDVLRWTRFAIEVSDEDCQTSIRARFWSDGTPEPADFAIDFRDASPARLTSGRIGIWSAAGEAYVDDLYARSPADTTVPAIELRESGKPLDSSVPLMLNRDARIEISAAASSPVTVTATLDGADYESLAPISSEGRHHLEVHAVAQSGRRADAELELFIDKTPPRISISESGMPFSTGAAFGRDVQPVVEATDFTPVKISMTLDEKPFTSGSPIAAEGKHILAVHAEDAVGFAASSSIEFAIDKTPPRITVTESGLPLANGSFLGRDALLAITATDHTPVAITATVDGAPYTPGTPVSGEAKHVLAVRAVDAIGLEATLGLEFTVDKTPPVVLVTEAGKPLVAGALFGRDVLPVIEATDLTPVKITATLDAAAFTPGSPVVIEGRHSLAVRVEDSVGLVTTVPAIEFTIDKTPPHIAVLESGKPLLSGAFIGHDAILQIETTDATAVKLRMTVDGVVFASGTPITTEGKHSLVVDAEDAVGQKASAAFEFTIDKTPPQVTVSESGKPFVSGGLFARDVLPVITATDATPVTVKATLDGTAYASETEIAAEGKHALSVSAEDAVGHVTTVPPIEFTIDKTAPRIAFTSPVAEQTIATAHMVVSGNADDAVSVIVNGTPAVLAAGRFNTPAPVDFTEGENTLTATAADAAGNTATAIARVFLDTRAPELFVSSPAADTCIDATSIEIRGGMREAAVAAVTVTWDGGSADAVVSGSTWSATASDLTEGEHRFDITATDRAAHSSTITLRLTIDRSRPEVAIDEAGRPFTAAALNRTIALALRVVDADPRATVESRLDGAAYTSGSAISTEGRHELRATAIDCAGHTSDEAVVAFTIDRTAPQIVTMSPPDGSAAGERPVVSGTASQDATLVMLEGTSITAAVTNGAFAFAELPLHEGVNALPLVVRDAAGNEGRFEYHLTLRTGAPGVTITESGSAIPAQAVFRRAAVPVIASTDPFASIDAKLNAAPFASGSSISTDGDYTLVATATDRQGHVSAPASATFTIDRTPPSIAIASPQPGASINADHVDVTGSVTGSDVAGISVNGVAASLGASSYSATVSLDAGPNLITAIATDRHGNSSAATVSVTRDDGRPGVVLVAPVDGMLTNRTTIQVVGQLLTPAAGASVRINGTDAPLDATGVFRVPDLRLVEGVNTITAVARASNSATNEASVRVTGDFTPPKLAVLANDSELAPSGRFSLPPRITAAATDDNGATMRATLDGSGVVLPLPSVGDGGHALTVVARDAAGNESRVDRSFVVGALGTGGPCRISDVLPPDASAVFGDTVRVTGRAAGAAGVLVNGAAASFADGSFCTQVPLQPGKNDIRIECADAGGSATSSAVMLTIHRDVEVSVAITSPANGTITGASSIAVSGTAGADAVSGDVNGIPFTIAADGAPVHAFNIASVPLANGLNVLTARVRSGSGRVTLASTRVRAFTAAPQIAITSPLPSAESGAPNIDVTGTYANIDPATITISSGGWSFPATVRPLSETTGTFAANVPLSSGTTAAVTASGRNRGGAATSSSVDLVSAAGAPSISIATPADNAFYRSDVAKVVVTGTISAGAGSTVQVNGIPAALSGSAFTATIDFAAAGATPVVARVTTPDGLSASDTVRVVRFAAPLSLLRTFPSANALEVDAGAALLALFSNAIDMSTAAAAFRLVDAAGQAIDGETFVDSDAVTFAPLHPLAAGTMYTLSVSTALRDLAGGSLASPVTFTFTTAAAAPATPPQLDQGDSAGCLTSAILTGHATTGGARMRLEVDGVTMSTTAGEDKSFRFEFTLSGQPGFHSARVRQIGADGSLSPERAVCIRVNCSAPQVLSASLDRSARKLTIVFSKAMNGATLVAAPAGTIALAPTGGAALTGTVTMNAASDAATVVYDAALTATGYALLVKKEVQDSSGNPMTADYEQSFSADSDAQPGKGEGYVTGTAIDEAMGRPLAGATVDVLVPVNAYGRPQAQSASRLTALAANGATTDDRGRYTRSLPEGAYTLQLSASGHTTAWRQVVVPAGAGVVPMDVRLMRRHAEQTTTGTALVVSDPGDGSVAFPVELALTGASLPQGRRVAVTSLAPQALPALLPPGWSPLAAAEIAIDGSAAPGPLPAARVSFTLSPAAASAIAAAGQTIALVHYDSDRDEWRAVVAVAAIGGDLRCSFDIASSGDYALVYPDAAPTLPHPPSARTGAPLQGVAIPCASTPDVCRLASRSFVLTPSTILPNGSTTATLTTDGAKPYPSGTALQALVDEQLNLADGRVVIDPPFATDLLVYRTPAGDAGIASFRLTPTAQATAATLRDGIDHVRIVDYPGRVDRGAMIGPAGGRLAGGDGAIVVDVPAGATEEALRASIATLSKEQLTPFVLAGFDVAAGFALSLDRVDSIVNAEGSVPAAPRLQKAARGTFALEAAAGAQVVVGEVVEATPYGTIVRLASLATAIGASGSVRTFTTQPVDMANLPVDGIVRAGRYLVLVARVPIAFAWGTVTSGASGPPVANARVTAGSGSPQVSALGVVDVTRSGGIFALPVASKPAAAFSLVASTPAAGESTAAIAPSAPDVGAIVAFGALALVPNAPRLVSLVPQDGSIMNASDPLAPRATFDAPIDRASAAGGLTIVNVVTGKALAGSVSATGPVVSFNPAEALVPGAAYAMTIFPSMRGTNGAAFGQTVVARFSTRAIPTSNSAIHPELIRITLPTDGRSTIIGRPGALPAGSQALAVRHDHYFVTAYQATVAADGSFAFVAGDGSADRIVTTDSIDLQVIDAVSRAVIALIPLTPFSTADGNGFLASPALETKFTTTTGVGMTVPPGAFDANTLITTTATSKSDFAAVPSFDRDLVYAASVQLNFDGVAKKRMQIDLPLPAGIDPAGRTFYLGYLGQSARGPRVMIVDTLAVANGRLTTARDSTPSLLARSNATSVGADVKNALLGATHAGTYAAVEINAGGSPLAWGIIDGLQGGLDLFWSAFDALYAASFYLTEGRGRVAIPLKNDGKKFEIVGVDASTGLTSFTKVYDPLPDAPAGTAVVLANPDPPTVGPYPVSAAPFRVEMLKLDAEEVAVGVRNFSVELKNGLISAKEGQPALPPKLTATLFNSANGEIDETRYDGLSLDGAPGDRIALIVEEPDVDPTASISVAFSKPLYLGGSADEVAIDAYLRGVMHLQSSRDPEVEKYSDVPNVHYRADSGGQRVLLDLPAQLQRGMAYQLLLTSQVADRTGTGGTEGLYIGQVKIDGVPTLPRPMTLRFRVRAPAGKLGSFDIPAGAIRDEALNGNVLLLSAFDAGILAYDVADPAAISGTSLLGVAQAADSNSWAVASDHHGRVYSTDVGVLFGAIRSYRLEDFIPDATHPAPRKAQQRSSGIVSFAPGASVSMPISSEILSDRPEAVPRKLQLLLRDDEESLSWETFKSKQKAAVTPLEDGFESVDIDFARTADFAYVNQRITVENLSLDLRWSADAFPSTPAHIAGILARKGDRIRILRNRMTYGVVSLFGFGIGVYDLNAIESNDAPAKPAGYAAIRELVRLTRAALRPECGWGAATKPVLPGAIPDLTFTPEAAILTRSSTPDLAVFAVDQNRGILDVTVHPPLTAGEAMNAPDITVCNERQPRGLTFQTTYTTKDGLQTDYDPRIAELRAEFHALAGRDPVGRFTGVALYHWSLEGKDNKAVGPAPKDGKPVPGARDSIADQRVDRDYLLVPAFEYGLLIVEAGGSPAPQSLKEPGYSPLSAQHLADIIWIPAGAYAVRVIPRTNLATVLDGDGRALLIDLSRIDERFANGGVPIASDALFATASYCLGSNSAYGVGLDDPRIVWKSDPQPDAIGTLAPIIDADTGFLFRGKLLGRSTQVSAAIDPRIQMKCELAQAGGLSEVSGVVPLGIDPPASLQKTIAEGEPLRQPDASAAAFRLEISLPGAVAEALAAAGGLRVAVESERVAGGVTPQTSDGLPRAHLRLKKSSGGSEPRPASAFALKRLIPASAAATARHQKAFNKFVSPWIVAIADPRASIDYAWTIPAGVSGDAAIKKYKQDQGCASCERPPFLKGLTEPNDVWELYTNGRLIVVRPDLCSNGCNDNVFSNTKYAYLGQQNRLVARFATVMADTVRPTAVLTAAQNPPVATGLVQETTYLHSGEVEVAHTDFDYGGRNGWNTVVDRTYRSRTIGGTALGAGWDSAMFRRLRPMPNGDVEYRDGEGEQWTFVNAGNGYVSPEGLFLRLTRNPTGWCLSDQKQRLTGFDNLGRLIYETDDFVLNPDVADHGNIVRYFYDAEGRLAAIIDPVGRQTKLEYGGDQYGMAADLLLHVFDERMREIWYHYDAWGRLTSVDLPKSAGVAPSIAYGYVPSPAGSAADRLELATNLLTITDPGFDKPRVTFTYAPTGDVRDRVTKQEWTATGESAVFDYAPQVKTTDALNQQRVVTLTGTNAGGISDRVHVATIEEVDVATAAAAAGGEPQPVSAGPQRALQKRQFSFSYYPDGTISLATLNGVETTAYTYKSPSSSIGVVPQKIETVPAAGGDSIARTFEYQTGDSSVDASSYLQSITANGAKIDAAEPTRLGSTIDNNDSVKRTTELDTFGRTAHVVTSGGTDGSGIGSELKLSYVPSTADKHKRGRLSSLTREDAASSLKTEIDYPDVHTIVERDVDRAIERTTTVDDWDRPVRVEIRPMGTALSSMYEEYEYTPAGRVWRQRRNERYFDKAAKDFKTKTVTTEYTYDALGRLLTTTLHNAEVDGVDTSLTSISKYLLGQRKIVQTAPTGAETVLEIDGLGRTQTRTTNVGPKPVIEELAYDLAGHPVFSAQKCVASCGAAAEWIGTSSTYDAHGRLVATLDSTGVKTKSSGFDGWGNPQAVETTAKDSVLARSDFSFTASGRLQKQTTKLGSNARESAFAWDGAGRSTASAESGRASLTRYDAAGRLTSSAAGGGSVAGVQTPFYSLTVPGGSYSGSFVTGGSLQEKAAAAVGLQYGYDAIGNLTKRNVGKLGWQQDFSESGAVLSSALPGRKPTSFDHDSRGLTTTETRADASELTYRYDAAAGMTRYTDPKEATITETDALGRPLKRTYPDTTIETFAYDGLRLWTYTDRQGRAYVYSYDSGGRLNEVRLASGELLEQRNYAGGRLQSASTADAMISYAEYDLGGRPHMTTQTRYKNHSGLASKEVLDQYSQKHDYNEHGERTMYTMPTYSGKASAWTLKIDQTRDDAGNIISIQRTLSGGTTSTLMTADFRNAGRPIVRTLNTECPAPCSSAPIVRKYAYNGNGQLNEMSVTAKGNLVAGSHVEFDGGSLQIAKATLLGFSGGRSNFYTYDARGRLLKSAFARSNDAVMAEEKVDEADFRHSLERTQVEPGDPPTVKFTEAPGHKIATMTRGSEPPRTFKYNGAERVEDGRFAYAFDARGRLASATELGNGERRRITYEYSATDRMVGRRAEYAAAGSSEWKLEDRGTVLAADALPAETTFVWDPITDVIAAVYKAGASASTDPNGGLVRQIIHGGVGYDDPLEVAVAIDGNETGGAVRLYPVYDEAAAGSLQAILDESAYVVSRPMLNGAYGEDEVVLGGVAIDRIAVDPKKDSSGALTSVDITMRATEALDPATLLGGTRLAAVSGSTVVRTTTAVPTLIDADTTIRWSLNPAQWSALTDPKPELVGGHPVTPTAISIAVTDSLRARNWSPDNPLLPAPDWVLATQPVFTSPRVPIEYRESLSDAAVLMTARADSPLSGQGTLTSLYEIRTLQGLMKSATNTSGIGRRIVYSSFHRLPFADPETSLNFVRQRWFDAQAGVFISPDPLASGDSANLYSYASGDPANKHDAAGAYSQDIHYYATYYLSRVAGFGRKEAIVIAYASQYVDEALYTNPFVNNGMVPFSARKRAEAIHFSSTVAGQPAIENNPSARAAVFGAAQGGDLTRLGIAVHTLADTFAHAGYNLQWSAGTNRRQGSNRPDLGHADAPDSGYGPDITSRDPDKALRATATMLAMLRQVYRQMYGSSPREYTEFDAHLIQQDIDYAVRAGALPFGDANKAQAEESLRRRIAVWRAMIQSQFGENVQYQSAGTPEGFRQAVNLHVQQLFQGVRWQGAQMP